MSVSFTIPKLRGPKPSQLLLRVELLRVEYALDAHPGPDPEGFRRRGQVVSTISEPPLDPGARGELADTTLGALPESGVGTILRYGVRVFDRRGRPSPVVVSRDLAPVPVLPAPVGLRAEATAEGVRLQWIVPEERTDLRFNVYRWSEGSAPARTPLNHDPMDASEFLDTEVKHGESYTYAVRSSTPEARPYRESMPSESVTALAEDRSAPRPPERLVAVQEGIGIRLLWSPNEETDLAGYRVYRQAAGEEWQRIGPEIVDHPTFLDRDVRVLDRFAYRVTALDRATPPNESSPSEAVEGQVAPEPAGAP